MRLFICSMTGSLVSRVRALFGGRSEMRILMNGLDAAGKTTILYKLKLGHVVTTIPTIGFNVETVNYKSASFTVWDLGGRDKVRALWKHYHHNTSALIWVVDSSDRERLTSGFDGSEYGGLRVELHRLLAEEELAHLPLLFFANKQDLPNALSAQEISDILELPKLRDREWMIQGCSAVSGDGLYEGLEWLSEAIKRDMPHAAARQAASTSAPTEAAVAVTRTSTTNAAVSGSTAPAAAAAAAPTPARERVVMDAISSDDPNVLAVQGVPVSKPPSFTPIPAAAATDAGAAEASVPVQTAVPVAPPLSQPRVAAAIPPPSSFPSSTDAASSTAASPSPTPHRSDAAASSSFSSSTDANESPSALSGTDEHVPLERRADQPQQHPQQKLRFSLEGGEHIRLDREREEFDRVQEPVALSAFA